MSLNEEFQVKNEYDDSSNFSSYYQDYKDDEQSDPSYLNESLGILTNIKTLDGNSISVYLRLGNRILFCSGKYFYIEHATAQTDHQKEYTGIVSTCHTCGVKIKGSLKVSSNFICHLKARHPEVYQEFLKQKQECGTGTRIKKSDKTYGQQRTSPYPGNPHIKDNILQQQEVQEQFQRNILQFLVATQQPLSIVEDRYFLKLFEFMDLPIQLKSPECYEQTIREECKYKQLELTNYFNHSKVYICLTTDVWSYGECYYLALACHWIDEQCQRQMALLACQRTNNLQEKSLTTLQNEILLQYGFQKEYIVNSITGNIQNFTKQFKVLGLKPEILSLDGEVTTENCFFNKQIQEDLKLLSFNYNTEIKTAELELLKLNKIWSEDFYKLLNENLKKLHVECMEKCCQIWQNCITKEFKEIFDGTLNAPLTAPNIFYLTSLYKSLKKILLNKIHLTDISNYLKKPSFSTNELDYLEDLADIYEPFHAAFEFLDNHQNHYYGCFLPTLVTLKWKLTRLVNSKKLKHLQEVSLKLKQQLLTEFKTYYELNESKSEAIIAAITYPPVKTRFLMGLQDSVLCFNFQARNLLLKYGKIYHIEGEQQTDNTQQLDKTQNSLSGNTTALDFFDFGDGTEKVNEDSHLPVSLKLEIDAYLADIDNTLMSLQKYPTIKRLFYRYNTCIPSPSSVLRLFPLMKILRNSLLTNCSHEQFGNLIFYQNHILNK
ncbi:uncharacterized protein LOC124420919 [Lucilia cuprina]|uniref:uncharacterized protein LOC124420919 n=1 Tax=Lucilia cuprina TaxID=7375 RepID=UPI001F066337|nr:uncharacterized protein LOC124420919 [Lucilia cuprina]